MRGSIFAKVSCGGCCGRGMALRQRGTARTEGAAASTRPHTNDVRNPPQCTPEHPKTLPRGAAGTASGQPRVTLREAALVATLASLSFVNSTEGGWAIDDARSFAGNRDVVGQLVTPPMGAETLGATAAGRAKHDAAVRATGDDGSANPYLPSSGVAVGDDLPQGSYLQPQPLAQIWADDFWGEPMASANSHKSYRPLAVLSFRLSYTLWSAVLPSGGFGAAAQRAYHAENVALHALVSVLLLAAVRRVSPRQPRNVGLGAAALFACHAVHCEAVANVTGRAELLAAGFFLASFLVYPVYSSSTAEVCVARLLASVVFGVLAMLAKEPGAAVFGLNFLVDAAAVFEQHQRQQHHQQKATPGAFPSSIRQATYTLGVRSLLLAFMGGGALGWRLALNNGQSPRFSNGANPAALTAPDSTTRWLTHAHVWVQSYWMLVCPQRLSVDWGYGSIPLIGSWGDERNLITAAGFLVVCVVVRWSAHHMPHTLTTAWISALVLPYLPASNLFFPVGFVIAERVMYLPSAGFCILAALICLGTVETQAQGGVDTVSNRSTQRQATQQTSVSASATWWRRAAFVCLVALNMFRALARNEDWRNCRSLWLSSFKAVPTNEFLPLGLGECILEQYNPQTSGDDDLVRRAAVISEAVGAYRSSLRINPSYGMAAVALAKLLHVEKQYVEEEHVLRSTLSFAGFTRDSDVKAVGGGREWRDMMIKLAELYESRGGATQNASAMQMSYELASVVRLRYPGTWRARMVEANVLYRAGRLDEAAMGFRAVLELEPRSHGALNNLGAILQQSSPPRLQEALVVYTAALSLPNSAADPALLNSYGTLLCNFEERYSEARESFKRALNVDPNFKAAKQGLQWVEAQLN